MFIYNMNFVRALLFLLPVAGVWKCESDYQCFGGMRV